MTSLSELASLDLPEVVEFDVTALSPSSVLKREKERERERKKERKREVVRERKRQRVRKGGNEYSDWICLKR